jgi:DNA-binding PadR family transcriptional regulator
MRTTTTVARVLRVFVDDPDAPRYGLELMKATGLASGSLYPILARLERAGWVRSRREQINAADEARPPRRYYKLTAEGLAAARHELATLADQLGLPQQGTVIAPRLEGGQA